jgi:hypothetical protein
MREIAGKDEEDVDTDEPGGETRDAGVKRDDEVDRDRAQAVELGPVMGRRPGFRCVCLHPQLYVSIGVNVGDSVGASAAARQSQGRDGRNVP